VKVTVIRESRAVDVARNVANGGQTEALPAAPEPQIQPDVQPQIQPDQAA
jgi:hypothetical protein